MKIEIRKINIIISLIIFFALALYSGFRQGGFDYEQYVLMIKYIMSESNFHEKLLVAKDPLFGLIVHIVSPSNDIEIVYVFFLISIIAFVAKIFFIGNIHRVITFSILYVLLLSPSLDFAAIRAMLGLMFLIICIKYLAEDNILFALFFGLLSIVSHISMILPVVLSMPFAERNIRRLLPFSYISLMIMAFLSKPILSLFKNTDVYINNSGTIFAVLPCLITLMSLVVLSNFNNQIDPFTKKIYIVAVSLVVMSIGFVYPTVIASSRYLQVAQILILILICNVRFKLTLKNILIYGLSVTLYIIPLLYRNIDFSLWNAALTGNT